MQLTEFNRSLRRLVALPILLLVLMTGFLVWQILAAARAQQTLDVSDRVTAQIAQLQTLIIDQETGLRGYQLTGDPVMLAPWQAATPQIQGQFDRLRILVTGRDRQSATLDELNSRYQRWLDFAHQVLTATPTERASPALNRRGKDLMDQVRASTNTMLRREENLRRTSFDRARRLKRRELLSLLISALLVGVILATFTRHSVHDISASYQRRIADITRNSEALFESRQWFQTTLESIGDAVISCDIRGGVTFMNAVAEQLTGWKRNEASGRPLEEVFRIINESTREPAENPVDKVRRERQVVGLANHTALIARDGKEYIINDSAAPILSGDGEMIGVVLVFRDSTEDHQMEAALIASEKLAVAGRLAASIAHEIHNPLDSVANLHFLLEQEQDPERRAEYLRLAQQELARTMQISRTMLSLYREPRAPISIDLKDLIDGVLLLLDRRVKNQGIELEKQLPEPLMVQGFPAELRQVFTNLIANAIEAVGPKGRIRIRMEQAEALELRGAGVLVEISDNGPGIPPHIVSRLFHPFFTTKGASGTGLGLWISMGIVQKHGGAIRAGSHADPQYPGACFRVFLPARTLAQAQQA